MQANTYLPIAYELMHLIAAVLAVWGILQATVGQNPRGGLWKMVAAIVVGTLIPVIIASFAPSTVATASTTLSKAYTDILDPAITKVCGNGFGGLARKLCELGDVLSDTVFGLIASEPLIWGLPIVWVGLSAAMSILKTQNYLDAAVKVFMLILLWSIAFGPVSSGIGSSVIRTTFRVAAAMLNAIDQNKDKIKNPEARTVKAIWTPEDAFMAMASGGWEPKLREQVVAYTTSLAAAQHQSQQPSAPSTSTPIQDIVSEGLFTPSAIAKYPSHYYHYQGVSGLKASGMGPATWGSTPNALMHDVLKPLIANADMSKFLAVCTDVPSKQWLSRQCLDDTGTLLDMNGKMMGFVALDDLALGETADIAQRLSFLYDEIKSEQLVKLEADIKALSVDTTLDAGYKAAQSARKTAEKTQIADYKAPDAMLIADSFGNPIYLAAGIRAQIVSQYRDSVPVGISARLHDRMKITDQDTWGLASFVNDSDPTRDVRLAMGALLDANNVSIVSNPPSMDDPDAQKTHAVPVLPPGDEDSRFKQLMRSPGFLSGAIAMDSGEKEGKRSFIQNVLSWVFGISVGLLMGAAVPAMKVVWTLIAPFFMLIGIVVAGFAFMMMGVSYPVASFIALFPGRWTILIDWAKACLWVACWIPCMSIGMILLQADWMDLVGAFVPAARIGNAAVNWQSQVSLYVVQAFGVLLVVASPIITNFIFNPTMSGLSILAATMAGIGAGIAGTAAGGLGAVGKGVLAAANSGKGAASAAGTTAVPAGAAGVATGGPSPVPRGADSFAAALGSGVTTAMTKAGTMIAGERGGKFASALRTTTAGDLAGAGVSSLFGESSGITKGTKAGIGAMSRQMKDNQSDIVNQELAKVGLGSSSRTPDSDRAAQSYAAAATGDLPRAGNYARGLGADASNTDRYPGETGPARSRSASPMMLPPPPADYVPGSSDGSRRDFPHTAGRLGTLIASKSSPAEATVMAHQGMQQAVSGGDPQQVLEAASLLDQATDGAKGMAASDPAAPGIKLFAAESLNNAASALQNVSATQRRSALALMSQADSAEAAHAPPAEVAALRRTAANNLANSARAETASGGYASKAVEMVGEADNAFAVYSACASVPKEDRSAFMERSARIRGTSGMPEAVPASTEGTLASVPSPTESRDAP